MQGNNGPRQQPRVIVRLVLTLDVGPDQLTVEAAGAPASKTFLHGILARAAHVIEGRNVADQAVIKPAGPFD